MDYKQIKIDIYPYLDSVFPELELKARTAKWITHYKTDGTPDKQHKSGRAAILPSGYITDQASTVDIFTYYQLLHPEVSTPHDAAVAMLKAAGMNPDDYDDASPAAKQTRDRRAKLWDAMRANFKGTAGERVRQYLATPIEQGGRGWSADDIDAAADYMGVVTDREEFESVTGLKFGYTTATGQAKPSTNWHTRTPLIMPTFNAYRAICYAKTRSLLGEKIFDNPNADLSFNPTTKRPGVKFDDVPMFNFNRAYFDGDDPERGQYYTITDKLDRRRLVIVESETCAIRCTIHGIKNVVALRGSAATAISRDNIINMVLHGGDQIVLMLDNDKKADDVRRFEKVCTDYSCGLCAVLVATLPPELGKDPDEIITRHGDEPVKQAIDNAVSFAKWNAAQFGADYQAAKTDGTRNAVQHSALEYLSRLDKIGQREFATAYAELVGDQLNADDIADTLETRQQSRDQMAFNDAAKRAAERLSKAIEDGRPDRIQQAFADMLKLTPPTTDGDPLASDHAFATQTPEQVFAELADNGTDIVTPYMFYGEGQTFPLRLKASGVTYICANTSHGKSAFMQNIAYWIATDDATADHKAAPVLYYSLEENFKDVLIEFINIHIHNRRNHIRHTTDKPKLTTDRNRTNYSVLRDYFADNDANVFDALDDTPDPLAKDMTERDKVGHLARDFVRETITGDDKTLYIIDNRRTNDDKQQMRLNKLPDLVRHIKAAASSTHPAAIFIDYIQRVKSGEKYLNTFDDLAEVTDTIQSLAQEIQIPIVCAAQMNRTNGKLSPEDMSLDNIAGSSSIEQGADTIILLYNSGKHKLETENNDGKTPKYVDWPVGYSVQLGRPGFLFGLIAKNRGNIGRGHALFKFNGAARWIDPHDNESAMANGSTYKPDPTPSTTTDDDDLFSKI